MLKLRPYQTDAIGSILSAYGNGITRQLITIPTGGGKTIIAASLARLMNVRTLFLAHREELIQQTKEKFEIVWPEAKVGIVKAKNNNYNEQVTIASIQTLARDNRLQQLDQDGYDLIICDEAHHAIAESYMKAFKYFGCFDGKDNLLVGITATPEREGLGAVFEDITYHISMLDLIVQGYLVRPTGIAIETNIDISDVGLHEEDFNVEELDKSINVDKRNELVVKAYKDFAKGRKTIVFTASVAHAQTLADLFIKRKVRAAMLSGETPAAERERIIEEFREGKIKVLTNCQILTEGFDDPSIECIIMARPTKSRILYQQIIGRGLRLYPNKKDCLIIDLHDNHKIHDVVTLQTAFGDSIDKIINDPKRLAQLKAEEIEQLNEQRFSILKEKTYDAFDRSNFRWVRVGSTMALSLADKTQVLLYPTKNKKKHFVVLCQGGDQPRFYKLHPNALELSYAQGIAEEYVRAQHKKSLAIASVDAEWRSRPVTDQMLAALSKWKIKTEGITTMGEASDLLSKAIARANTYKATKYGVYRMSTINW